MTFVGLIVLVAVTLGIGVSGVLAQDSPAKTPDAVDVTITGVNHGLLSSLAKGAAASANGVLAQMNVLKVTEAKMKDGAAIAELAGKTLYYVPSKTADSVITGERLRGKNITISGKLFKDVCAILVEEVQAEGGEVDAEEWETLPKGDKSNKFPVL
jgi:hypothetical protein